MNGEEERFYDAMRRSGENEYSARSAAANCVRALDAARLEGLVVGGFVGGVAGMFATRFVGGLAGPPGAVIGGVAGTFLKAHSAWGSESCEEVRDARSVSGVGIDPYDILPFPIR